MSSQHPRFVVIGAMKAGTTTVFDWLGQHPDVVLPKKKELAYLHRSEATLPQYLSMLPAVEQGRVTGEASPQYADTAAIALVAERITAWLPEARLVYVVREPVARLRSHYAHEFQRGRETRPIGEAVLGDPSFVARSQYADIVQVLLDRGLGDRLLVERFEDLFKDDGTSWARVLAHVGLSSMQRPSGARNNTAQKGQFRPLMGAIYGPSASRLARWVPRSVKRRVKPLLIDDSASTRARRKAAKDGEIPAHVVDGLNEQAAKLARLLDRPPLWKAP